MKVENKATDISVIIVNYKVKEYISNLLNSLHKARHGLNLEIFVVDNASGDDSIPYLKERFPNVNYIQNKKNVGFGKANNQAIQKATGTFTLIINPDTLVSEDTLTALINHMNANSNCGAAGCKILNPDGTFAPESRRSIPTIWSAACKVLGLNNLFPKSKLFGEYYLSWMPENQPSKVPVLSGSFMFWKTELLQNLGGFDERFFMYGEDIDLCYRIQQTNYYIDYVPETSIIHYKGESTKKGDLRYIRIFNKALYQFFDKHYTSRYSTLFRVFIYLAILLKTVFSFVGSKIRQFGTAFYDLIFLNISLLLGFAIRFYFDFDIIWKIENLDFLWINLLLSMLYLASAGFFGVFKSDRHSISAHIKAILLAYTGIILITFFARELAYSRFILVISFLIAIFFTIAFRLFKINRTDIAGIRSGKLRNSNIIIVGDVEVANEIAAKIHSRPDWSYEVIGYVQIQSKKENTAEKYIGSLAQLKDLIKAYKADQVFFALKSISYKQMLKEISNLQKEQVIFKLIPDSMDFILGKSKVEYLESMPLVEVEFAYNKPVNKLLKKMLDIVGALSAFVILMVFTLPALLFGKKEFIRVDGIKLYKNILQNKWKNRLRLMGYVLSGKLSLVGSEITSEKKSTSKKGISGLVQLNQNKIQEKEDVESFELYYLQNYSVWMDIDILIKTVINGPRPLQILAEHEMKTS